MNNNLDNNHHLLFAQKLESLASNEQTHLLGDTRRVQRACGLLRDEALSYSGGFGLLLLGVPEERKDGFVLGFHFGSFLVDEYGSKSISSIGGHGQS